MVLVSLEWGRGHCASICECTRSSSFVCRLYNYISLIMHYDQRSILPAVWEFSFSNAPVEHIGGHLNYGFPAVLHGVAYLNNYRT